MLNILDLSSTHLDLSSLEDIKLRIENETSIGHVLLGTLPAPTREHESKLFENYLDIISNNIKKNNKTCKHMPFDLIQDAEFFVYLKDIDLTDAYWQEGLDTLILEQLKEIVEAYEIEYNKEQSQKIVRIRSSLYVTMSLDELNSYLQRVMQIIDMLIPNASFKQTVLNYKRGKSKIDERLVGRMQFQTYAQKCKLPSRNPSFFGCLRIFNEFDAKLNMNLTNALQKFACLLIKSAEATGGGKTSAVLEYCHRIAHLHCRSASVVIATKRKQIVWIDASSQMTLRTHLYEVECFFNANAQKRTV